MAGQAEQIGDFDEVEILDLAEINLPFLDEPHHPQLGRYTKPHTIAWSQPIDTADALVIVTPEYNAGYPGAAEERTGFPARRMAEQGARHRQLRRRPGGGARAAGHADADHHRLGLVPGRKHRGDRPRAAGQVVDGEFVATIANDAAPGAMLAELAAIDADLAPRRAALAPAS